MAAESNSGDLIHVVTLLGAAVIAVPLFKKIGLGSVLGYLAAGLIIGPFGFGLFKDPHSILHVAELGVVMFLFVIGMEMRPSHLWGMRKDIFGLGSIQIVTCTAILTLVGIAFGFSPVVSFISGMGFVLTSTAIVFQILNERGEVGLPHGQKMVSILLFEDLLIVPLLALVAFLSPVHTSNGINWHSITIAVLSMAVVIATGIWLLNPLFRILANARSREVLTAAALLVVLGTALLMQVSGLSMAMGAFLAGVLLAESSFRHQIEADIEPFRGILLGLFFMGVGMSLNLDVVQLNIHLIVAGVLAMMLGKAICIYGVARLLGSHHREALDRSILMAQGGEFAFVLYAAAAQANVISAEVNANMTAIVVLSMVLTPLVVIVAKKIIPAPTPSLHGVETAEGVSGSALLIGFGRFGQVVSQLLLARDMNVTIIDSDADSIRSAREFGFQVYYGDGARLDVLRTSGAEKVSFIAVCVDKPEVANKIVELVKAEFRQARLLVRAYDRIHARELTLAGADYQIRETFESALLFGEQALREVEVPEEEIMAIVEDIRGRDRERMLAELSTGGLESSRKFIHGNLPKPSPLVEPKRESKILNPEGISDIPLVDSTTST
jgi:glutathione-regulated potassium-efflux system protein KefB